MHSPPSQASVDLSADRVSPIEIENPSLGTESSKEFEATALFERAAKGSWLWFWIRSVVFLAIVGTGWGTFPKWKPWIERFLPGGAVASTKPPPRPTPVSIAVVKQQDVALYINALGTVTAFNTVTVKSRVDGELKRVEFTEGQMVSQGDLLVELDSRPLEASRDQVQGQLERDQASLELARLTVNRLKTLVSRDATSQQELDEQTALYKQAEAMIHVDRANLQNAQLQVDYTRITAPISGRIGLRLVDRGNIVKANDPNGLLVITQLQPISLVFAIPQDDIPRVQLHAQKEKELAVEAFDRDFAHRLAVGKLTAIDNQVDATTGTLRMKATFDNDDNLLFPNQFVNVRLKVETLSQVITVPSLAVQRGPDNKFVYVVKEDQTVEVRKVEVGAVEGTLSVIASGLEAGERVVTEGIDKLQPGSKVNLPKAE